MPPCQRSASDRVKGPAAELALPSLAIIVPVYNEAQSADPLLGRLDRLTDCELVVVDGGSSDQTVARLTDTGRWPALAAARARGSYRVLAAARGRAQQMNYGASQTRAEVLVFLHADTSFHGEQALAVRRAVATGADFGCFALRIDSRDPRLRLASRLISLRSRWLASATGDQAIFVRRALFAQLGGYRELDLCEDLDLIKRARRHGRFRCLTEPVCTSARRWERGGVTRTILLMWLIRLAAHAGVDPRTLRALYQDVR